MADQLYDLLSKVKEDFNQINTAIHQEEDVLFGLTNTVKEQEEKNQFLTSELAKLEMAAQLAESEATVDLMKKENLIRKVDSLRNEILETEAKLDQKDCNFQDVSAHFESKKKELEALQERNHAKYMAIPCLRKYIEAGDQCAHLSETVSQLVAELNELKVEYAAVTGAPENNGTGTMDQDDEQTFIETIQLESTPVPAPPPSNLGLGIPMDIQAIFAKLMEENQLLKSRLERLEMSQASVLPLDQTAAAVGATSIPFENQETPAPPVQVNENSVAPKKIGGGGGTGIPVHQRAEAASMISSQPSIQTTLPAENVAAVGETPSQRSRLSQANRKKFSFSFKSPVKANRAANPPADVCNFSPSFTSIPEEMTNILMDTSSGNTPGPMQFSFSPGNPMTSTPMSLPSGDIPFMNFGFNGSPSGGSFF